MDELLTATQERLAGQSEKLIAAEERLREMERQATIDAERLEELEAQLRQHQMADQMRELQGPKHEQHEADAVAPGRGRPPRRRRSSRRCRWTRRRRSRG